MTPFAELMLSREAPASAWEFQLPHGGGFFPSPADWRDEVLYFLLVDRFSDERLDRPRLDRANPGAARPNGWQWQNWSRSGGERWQGGTLRGVRQRLGYLKQLGVTALWLSPVFKQRGHTDTYHGYAIQDFLDVDPRLGTRRDLVDLVDACHQQGMRVILDVIVNHTGCNWLYPGNVRQETYTPARHGFGDWIDGAGAPTATIRGRDDGCFPTEMQSPDAYTRAGSGDLGRGDVGDDNAENKRCDFMELRDVALDQGNVLASLAQCYKYWMALTDCDGFRIDTVKHITFAQARAFCGAIKEYAASIGKHGFLLTGEMAGGDFYEDAYLDVLGRNMDAALDIGQGRLMLNAVAKGLAPGADYFIDFFNVDDPGMGSHRSVGGHHVSILDDHDHVAGQKLRLSAGASQPHQVAAGIGIMLLSLGIPCLYYGDEQGMGGPEESQRGFLPGWGGDDRYLREAMFGPEHPRASGRQGLAAVDAGLPGFGPFGTAGQHCFDPGSPVFRRVAHLAEVRRSFTELRLGRQYLRQFSFLGYPFGYHRMAGEIVAWSRILDRAESLCILNSHGTAARGARIVVDAQLNDATMNVVGNTVTAAGGGDAYGAVVPVQRAPDGTAFVEIANLPPAEMLVLSNH